jgi:UDP-N-acetylglucosamine:LPS N-acetylglucosamine transferase
LSHKDEQNISREIEGLKKIDKNSSPDLTTRLKYVITPVQGSREKKDIREFVDKWLLAKDSRALREYIKTIQPDVDLSFFPDGSSDRVNIPIGISFFWPDV